MLSLHTLAITAVITLLLHSGAGHAAEDVLSLDAAQAQALKNHPELGERTALVDAARAGAASSDALPDPQLTLGMQNVPTDSLALNRDDTTMTTVGVTQMFPPPGQRAQLRHSADQETSAAEAERTEARARIQRDVRRAWLEVFYLDRALAINSENSAFVAQMTEAETARYRVGAAEQSAVLKSALEGDALLDEQQDLAAQREAAVSRLARLLDSDAATLRITADLPTLPAPPTAAALLQGLAAHPQIRALEAARQAAGYQTAAARRAYYPEFGVEATYGYRAARDAGGAKLPDMLSAQVVMSLPLFPDKRQDARLQERAARERAARYRRDDALLALRAEATARLAEHQRLQARLDLLENSRLPKAEQAVQAALAAYKTNRLPLAEVLAVMHERHQYALTQWRLKTDLALNTADLDYLAATTTETSDASH
jgi:outer membrane protein, heavy metal efflux system